MLESGGGDPGEGEKEQWEQGLKEEDDLWMSHWSGHDWKGGQSNDE